MLRRRLFGLLAVAPLAGLAAVKVAEAKPTPPMSPSAVNDAVRQMIGEIRAYAGEKAPPDCLLCYGQAVSRTAYADLFKAIGTTFGVGDGKTTFNLPDFRPRVVTGIDAGGCSSVGRLGTLGDNCHSHHVHAVAWPPPHFNSIRAIGSIYSDGIVLGHHEHYVTGQYLGNGEYAAVPAQPTLMLQYVIRAH